MGITIDDMSVFCKRKGFVYPNSEVYGGMSGFFDYGPLGVELKNSIKAEWWKTHVTQRDDIVGIDGSIITNPKVWVASGHVESFTDVMLKCSKCGNSVRADHLVEEKLKIHAEGLSPQKLHELIEKNKIKCEKCKSEFDKPKNFNMMFSTTVGPSSDEKSVSYLRPETAQLMFANFKLVQENARMKLPFGIAQVGKAFRNEISPRDFLFRCREFEQMEIEYFVNPEKGEDCPYVEEFSAYELNVLSEPMQEKKEKPKKMAVNEIIAKKIMLPWHAYWLAFEQKWFEGLGADKEKFRVRQHMKDERSHYATDTWDLEYSFPFGWKELQGISNRGDFDLKQHIKVSGKDLSYYDEGSKKKVIPNVVAEPSLGVERSFLVFMFNAYEDDKKRGNIVLKLHPKLAPVKVAVFPLLSNKDELVKKAREVYDSLKKCYQCAYDTSGSIGRRYARNDEIGTLLGCTIDFDSLKDESVTLRDRDSTKQIRVKIEDLKCVVGKLIKGEKFESLGKLI
ncbi:glycine--tRNA ligase [Candidatus Woesearchaeota archaeon]|nr:glycine--tRNA ligase [Candidatus Woesearchaeota archaeon]